jgi:choline dehydrogenase
VSKNSVDEYDYVVVGAGSAGCVLAARLSENPDVRVLVLEAGPRDSSWTIRMPAALRSNFLGGRYNWAYHTEAEPLLGGRRLYQPRGRGLGGSSSINGMVYVRGHALDYERWVTEGARGWSFAEVLPYFKRIESHETGGDPWHGDSGPVRIERPATLHPINEAFLEAGEQAGYARSDDLNGYRQEGFGRFDRNVDHGVRASAAQAFLHPAAARKNLTVRTAAHVARLTLHKQRLLGVEYLSAGRTTTVTAAREVVLAAGAFGSPQILMLSGIGPAAELEALGIEPLADLPGVGKNLHDHIEIHVQHACSQPIAMNRHMTAAGKARIGLQWLLFRSGIGAGNHSHVGAFIRSAAGVPHPDIQYHFWPYWFENWDAPPGRHGYCFGVGTLRPASRGEVRLRSTDPAAPPRILLNALVDERDLRDLRACLELTRELAAQHAFDPFRGAEATPGSQMQDGAALDDWIRAHAASAYHPCGTCRMGTGDDAVVDAQARVRGVAGLRVVDASIMPSITSGNINAPVMMLADKISDLVRGRDPLPPADVSWYVDPEYAASQR